MPTLTHGRIRRVPLLAATALLAIAATACIPPAGTIRLDSSPAPAGCIGEVGPADLLLVTGCGGDVTYNVSVPSRCAEYACGLIVDVHGWTMSGAVQETNTAIAAIGREEGYVVIQPNAPVGSGGQPSWSASHYPHVAAFVELAIGVWRVDARRVHITGFSQGGAMTTWMRCNRPDLFASAAPTAMSGSACANGVNMPTLYIQGTNDVFVSQAAIDATIASYVNRYGLDIQLVLAESDDFTITAYGSTTPDTPVFETYIHHYSSAFVNGHCIAGSPVPADLYGCDQPTPHPHGRTIVDFFKHTPRST